MNSPPEEYQQKVLNRLRQRNASQSEAFRGLIENNRELLQLNCQYRSRISALEDLSQKGGGGGGGEGGGEMKEKCDKLQRDLIESLKRNSENAALIMETTKQIQETNKLLVQKEKELTEAQQKHEQLEEEKKIVDGVLAMVREEYSAMKIQFHRCQKQMSKLSEEHDDLVQRWMELKTNEAERLNEINQMHNNAMKEVQKAKAAAAGSAVMAGSNTDLSSFATGKKCDLPKGAKRQITGHKGDVNSICYNVAGNILASGGNDKLIRVWNVRNFQAQSTLSGPVQSVMCVKFSPNEEYILGTSNDHSIRIWGAQDGRVRHTLTGHLGKVFAGSFSEDSKKVVSGSYDRSLKIWDMSRGYCIRTLFGQSSCTDVEFAQLANMLVSAHIDSSLRFWDTRTGNMIHEVSKIHNQKITSVSLSPDSRTLLTCSRDGTIKTSDIRTYEPIKVFAHSDFRAGVDWARACFSSDGRYVAGGGHTGSVFIWDVNTAKVAKRLDNGHKDTVAAVVWNPHGNQLCSCDKNGVITFWE
mmetsp:Transcript_17032/g.26580  ORF Transcript_17032/g.26580 Transcript_17032/m.26580 type:complete len:526 (-) Transcript_17032:96-1673(-)